MTLRKSSKVAAGAKPATAIQPHDLPTRPCDECGTPTDLYQLVEVAFFGMPRELLCWTCVHRFFDVDERMV